jgi:hypothetical protein
LVGQGAIALGTGIALLVLGGVIVALMTHPPYVSISTTRCSRAS